MTKKIVLIAALIVALFLVAIISLPLLIGVDQFRPAIEDELRTALGRPVHIGHLDLSIARGDLKADEISIADDPAFSSAPFVEAKSLEVGIDLAPLIFSRALHIRSITLRGAQVALLRSQSGKWNFSSLAQNKGEAPASHPSGKPDFTVEKLRILDSRLSVGMSPRGQQAYDGVDLTADNISLNSAIPFTLQTRTPGGGTLAVEGKGGPINQQDAAETPFEGKVTLKQADLAATGFIDPSSGIAGVVDYQGVVRSDGKVAHSEGSATVQKFRAVPHGTPASQPISFDYASDYDLAKQAGVLSKGQLHIGKGALNVSGAYDLHGSSPVLRAKLNGPNVPLQYIQAILPAVGVTLPAGASIQGGVLNTNLSSDGPVERLVTTGDLNISNAKLTGFSLASKLATLSAFSGLKASPETVIQVLSSNLRMAPEGIRLDNLKLVVADVGTVTGAGTISADHALNFRMVANVAAGGPIASLTTLAGLKNASSQGVPFFIQGTTSNPTFALDTQAVVNQGISGLIKSQTGNQSQGLGGVLGGILGQKKK